MTQHQITLTSATGTVTLEDTANATAVFICAAHPSPSTSVIIVNVTGYDTQYLDFTSGGGQKYGRAFGVPGSSDLVLNITTNTYGTSISTWYYLVIK